MNNNIVPMNQVGAIAPHNAMLPRSILAMSEGQVGRLKMLAEMMAACQLSYAKINNQPAKAGDLFIVMLKGVEVGLEPLAAMDTISIIQGKPALSPQGMLALINRSNELENMAVTHDDSTCTVTMKRKGRDAHTETFSMNDANAMQLTGKDNWKKQARTMRKWRAIAACARVVFPDVIQGLYTPEELDPDVVVGDDGELMDRPQRPALPQPQMHIVETPVVDDDNELLPVVSPAAQQAEEAISDEGRAYNEALNALYTEVNRQIGYLFNHRQHLINTAEKILNVGPDSTASALVHFLIEYVGENHREKLDEWHKPSIAFLIERWQHAFTAGRIAEILGVKSWSEWDGGWIAANEKLEVASIPF